MQPIVQKRCKAFIPWQMLSSVKGNPFTTLPLWTKKKKTEYFTVAQIVCSCHRCWFLWAAKALGAALWYGEFNTTTQRRINMRHIFTHSIKKCELHKVVLIYIEKLVLKN